MAIDYTMPKLAMAMNEGTINEWLLNEGDYVEKGRIDGALREAIKSSDKSLNALSKESRVHSSALSRFGLSPRPHRAPTAFELQNRRFNLQYLILHLLAVVPVAVH